MPLTDAQVDIQGFSSWLENKHYSMYDRLEDELKDPIFELFSENKDPDKSLTIDYTGKDNARTGRTRSPGGNIETQAPVEEDTLSQTYLSFEDAQSWEWEALVHDKYRYADSQPEELITNVMRGPSRLMHHQLFNSSDEATTTITLPGSGGSYDLALPNGQPVFSTSQSGPGYSGKANLKTGDNPLSTQNIGVARQIGIENFVRSGGERKSFRGDTIIIPDNALMLEAALQHTKSTLVAGSDKNAINIYSGGSMNVVVLKYAPEDTSYNYDTNNQYDWILADMNELKKAFEYKFIARPTILSQNNMVENGNSQMSVLCRFACYCKRWQFGVRMRATTAPTHPEA